MRRVLSRSVAVGAMAAVSLALAGISVPGGPSGAVGSGPSGAARAAAIADDVHLNEIQTIGSHNSYHLIPSEPEVVLRHSVIGEADQGLLYQHAPLPVQFASQKVRQIELDVFLDQAGGRYAAPLLRSAAGVGPYDPAMGEPGIKVLHVQDVDYATTCLSFKACIGQVKAWSDANPSHVPIAILVELKDDPLTVGDLHFTDPEPWTSAGMDTLDAEIRSVFAPGDLITPDDVRGSRPTLEDAVLTDGWPTLRESRGKVMLLMDNGGGYRTDYLAGHPSLEGRVLFTDSDPGQPDAAFVKRNDSADEDEIRGLVAAGYVVRTRADGDTVQARSGDTATRDAALRSGAQWVSTDYPVPGMAVGFTSDYYAAIPGGTVARCNPVNAPPSCRSEGLEAADPTNPSDTTTTSPGSSTTTGSSSSIPGSTPTTAVGGTSTTRPGGRVVLAALPARVITGRPTYAG